MYLNPTSLGYFMWCGSVLLFWKDPSAVLFLKQHRQQFVFTQRIFALTLVCAVDVIPNEIELFRDISNFDVL